MSSIPFVVTSAIEPNVLVGVAVSALLIQIGEAPAMQFATQGERTTFVAGFALLLVGLVLILAGSTAIGLVVAIIGGVVLVYSILRVQRRAPAVRDESQQRP